MNLVLNTFGSSLLVENSMFLVIHNEGKQVIDPSKVRSISISKGAKISSDAALLAIENEIDVMFIDRSGKPTGRLWSVKYGSISTIRRKQLDFAGSVQAVEWVKEIVIWKIDNQIALLISMNADEEVKKNTIASAINKTEDYKNKIRQIEARYVHDMAAGLRGWEGASARAYFEVLSMLLPEKYRFNSRSQHPATDIFNCLLNYGYGMLYGKVEGALIKAGIDPYAGIYHRDEYNRPVLAYDVIEVFRIWIDYVVFSLCMQEVIDEDCYSIKEGSYWLENLGRRILIQSVNDYLDEIIPMNGLERSRAVHIDLYAQNLAQKFLKS